MEKYRTIERNVDDFVRHDCIKTCVFTSM